MPTAKIIQFDASPQEKDRVRRPPGSLPHEEFADQCVGCGDCGEVCPDHSIEDGPGGYPMLADGAACRLCGLCADICMHGAISLTPETRRGLDLVLAAERLRDRS
jgi:ferredoxin